MQMKLSLERFENSENLWSHIWSIFVKENTVELQYDKG